MKNDECVIKILRRNGHVYQTFHREKNGWIQINSKGTVRPCTAEQLLSHMLPALAGLSSAEIKVERNTSP